MSSAAGAPGARQPLAAPRMDAEAVRDASDSIGAAVMLAAVVFLMHLLLNPGYTAPGSFAWSAIWDRHPLQQLVSDALGAALLLVAVAGADRLAPRLGLRSGAYVLAVLLAATTWAGIEVLVQSLAGVELAWMPGDWQSGRWITLFGFFEWLMLGSAATFLYLDYRRAKQEDECLQLAVLERSRAAKRVLEGRLQAMQARVEPQFLFNTLAAMKGLYCSEFASGERMLDGLIAYLRAAMPQMRDTTSTIGREVELARAYLEIARLRFGERLAVEIDAPADADDIRMPPMMLLPLIDQVFVHGFGHSVQSGSIRIACRVVDGTLRVTIAHNGGGFINEVDADTLSAIRDRLATLYGDAARLDVRRRRPWTTEAIMELPYEKIASAGANRAFARRES